MHNHTFELFFALMIFKKRHVTIWWLYFGIDLCNVAYYWYSPWLVRNEWARGFVCEARKAVWSFCWFCMTASSCDLVCAQTMAGNRGRSQSRTWKGRHWSDTKTTGWKCSGVAGESPRPERAFDPTSQGHIDQCKTASPSPILLK